MPMASVIEMVCVQLFRDNTEYQTATAAKEYMCPSLTVGYFLCVYACSIIPLQFISWDPIAFRYLNACVMVPLMTSVTHYHSFIGVLLLVGHSAYAIDIVTFSFYWFHYGSAFF